MTPTERTALRMTAALVPAAMLAACASVPMSENDGFASATMRDTQGDPSGLATLTETDGMVELAISVEGLTPGEHGFHLHTTGRCTLPDFTSAGGHLNPTGMRHGLLGDDGSHLGDLPNLVVGANGTGRTQVTIDASASYVMDQLFDADGTAIVIHAGADDGMTDPAGAAGPRVLCGVIERG